MAARRTRKDDGSNWTVADSRSIYGIRHWGAGYFAINDAGNVEVRPQGADAQPIDLHALVGQLREAGLSLPLLVRFPDILQDRVRKLTGAFDANIARLEYGSRYTALYPIKVNQQEAVVESIIATQKVSIGLEAGSKPELMAVLALAPKGGTIVCNGYKDREFIKLALMGQKLGHNVFIVIEKESEVQLVIEEAEHVGVLPQVGLRVRLSSLASSKWADTGGEKAKFGLSAAQLLSVVERFRKAGLDQGVRLLHFHMGSQIANLADYQHGFKEAIRYYGELRALGLPVDHVDVGGGLGVDYDGTHSRNASSINYDIDDYAGVVVGMLKEFCDAQGLPHPHIFSESGRALTAHHAVLITQVTDVERHNDELPKITDLAEQPEIVQYLADLLGPTDAEMVTETYWRATHYMSDAASQYAEGKISLAQKALAEQCYFAICRRLHNQLKARQRSHRQVLDELNDKLADKYICNFSVFQSLPDTWAIGQVLPILPIHRLGEEPDRRAVLQDLTCDSDGKITQYVDEQSIETSLPVHDVKEGEDYLIGVFLVGAYQEILGDMHNLFGDTDSVNVYQNADGSFHHAGIETHDTIEDMLRYVHLSPEELMTHYRDKVAGAKLTARERTQFLDALRLGLTRSAYLSS
ncbi:arginine decarboxylase [Pseudomonas citronellolis]|uniref:Biosynthetic arginine decarboxylase n=1 Tax=Pseudomonas citronellolis TaxID=53408 RepID=A0AAQ1KHK1_9PSED|nr:arginine decarboxylase [Pseudomonas citronellolis]MCP1646349.1 arginine decarboxylase [Pseudomonas citronellolis]MCP1669286.1 arginine decarboxylase [Pseudomonas citronellolis]MCP1700966.1 arginine decarboxylase [Pseudomonas citronellolis]MCP1707209.1 arginine decarboxylase [Pseudomonas citronellolis]MCP1800990.1 arginine decarboxylase [Pseudomonas citronellolis]